MQPFNNTTLALPGWSDELDSLSISVAATNIFTGSFSLLGNTLVIAVMLKRFRTASTFKKLLAHLAFCDIIYGISILLDTPNWIKKYWVYTPMFCKILPTTQFASSLAAEGTVVVIAIERYRGITQPLKVQWNNRDLSLSLIIAWLFAFVSASPYFNVLNTVAVPYLGNRTFCIETWSTGDYLDQENAAFIYSTYTFVGTFMLPMVILAVLYGRIIYIIRKPIDPIPCFEQLFIKRREKDIRITKLLILVIVAFALCVLPNQIGHFIMSKAVLTESEKEVLYYVLLIPYPFQCVLNPLIYSIVDKKFRKDARQILSCQGDKERKISRTMTSYFMVESTSHKKTSHSGETSLCSMPLRSSREETESLFWWDTFDAL